MAWYLEYQPTPSSPDYIRKFAGKPFMTMEGKRVDSSVQAMATEALRLAELHIESLSHELAAGPITHEEPHMQFLNTEEARQARMASVETKLQKYQQWVTEYRLMLDQQEVG